MHLPTKNTTIRLDKEMIEEVDDLCKEQKCTRNDYIKNAIENKLELDSTIENEENSQDQEQNSPRPDDNTTPKEELKIKVEDIPELKNVKVVESSSEPELKRSKGIITEVRLDNSNEPSIPMRNFNGQYFPKAELDEI